MSGIRTQIDRLFEGAGDIRQQVLDGIARAFWVDWFSNEYESNGGTYPPGTDMEAFAPRTSAAAKRAAAEALAQIERENDRSIEDLFAQAMQADEKTEDQWDAQDAHTFGWYLGMEMMGHGVSWFDDHERFDLQVPYQAYDGGSPEEYALVGEFFAKRLRSIIPDPDPDDELFDDDQD